MEQNYFINMTNEIINNLYYDVSNTLYEEDICYNNVTSQLTDSSSSILNSLPESMFIPFMFRPININYLNEDNSHNNTLYSSSQSRSRSSSTYLQNIIYNNNTTYDSSYITIAALRNNYYNNSNFSRAISLRDVLRSLYTNYYLEDENNTFLETFINSTFENKAKFKKVISTSELEKLKPQKFNKINESTTNIQCPILCYNFEENEEIIKLPCNHNYNCEAIIKWLSQESNTCPVCRHEFDYKEINIDNKRQTQDLEESTREESTREESTREESTREESTREESTREESINFYNLFSSEDILMQELLLNSYSNTNHSNTNH